jgi:dTDP-4-dehydrorhamnose reductase
MKSRVWVTGSGGLIGSYVVGEASVGLPIEVVPLNRQNLDLLDFHAVRERFELDRPDGIIHCAAIANTGICERDAALAQQMNCEVSALLSSLVEKGSFVFVSTDIVFDGSRGNYLEDDSCSPINVYGRSKRDAELRVLENPLHCVIRLSLNGGTSPTGDRGFNEVIRGAFSRGETVTLFSDEYRQPIPAQVTAKILWQALLERWSGIFHLGGAERMSRFEIGQLLAERWGGLNPRVVASSLRDFAGGKRAPDTSMNCEKIQQRLNFPIPGLRKWLRDHPDEIF